MHAHKMLFIGSLAVVIGACGSRGDSASTDAAAAPATSTAASPVTSEPAATEVAETPVVDASTPVEVEVRGGFDSHRNHVGDAVEAAIARDVRDARGRVVIPAGSHVGMHISAISPGRVGEGSGGGNVELTATSVTVHGVDHEQHIVVHEVPHDMKPRSSARGEPSDVVVKPGRM